MPDAVTFLTGASRTGNAGDADTKELFVRQDIAGGFRIVPDNQTIMDAKIDVDHGREGDQVSKARDFGSGLLFRLYRTERRFRSVNRLVKRAVLIFVASLLLYPAPENHPLCCDQDPAALPLAGAGASAIIATPMMASGSTARSKSARGIVFRSACTAMMAA
jgi:hypothetical protein